MRAESIPEAFVDAFQLFEVFLVLARDVAIGGVVDRDEVQVVDRDQHVLVGDVEEAAQVGFDVGTRTQAELLNAVRERYAAQRDFALARYAYVLATLELKRAAGKLTAGDLDEINSMLR